ncbi:ABC transporter ATP-binding protein [Flavihumibacter stibioxidans]|uniref:ABC transporter domain-containing protein n=1 Tax=Flavihumibacter stibioxidans TaxID=1834163 RepID=A0ABR7M8T4_9BACT|nr:ABC transporter ATP-binding protein [Flavihumibacter stibioxidans]MBC6491031.1 hypothetical protein [Flavihumibacter stibioxidans]
MPVAIKAENISKAYQLGEFSTGTLSQDIERAWYRFRGKEDPFLKIGETNDRTMKGESNIVWSLRDINFEINQGDAVGIIGRNGAGKSTLLKLLSRVTTPTTGSIKVRGRIASLLEVGTGFHPELTGRENIFLNGAILGMRKHEIKKRFDEIVDFAGVERYLDTPVKRYSSGMYVRLAFAVAAHLESEILVVDEVLAVGDAEFQSKCLGKMGDVSKGEGRTVLFVSHNMASIQQLCNKGILLLNGKLVDSGDTESIIKHYLKLSANNSLITQNNIEIDENTVLEEFKLTENIRQFEKIEFVLKISSNLAGNVKDLKLVLESEFGERVCVVDLRGEYVENRNEHGAVIVIKGRLVNVPLLPGMYSAGIYIETTLLKRDIMPLGVFEILNENQFGEQYSRKLTGHISINLEV